MIIKDKNSKIAGFTLLFALLVVSVALAISVGVSNILREEIKLSGTAKDSQLAFYAADTGTECALYIYRQGYLTSGTPQGGVTCSGQNINIPLGGSSNVVFALSLDNGSCANVSIVTTDRITITSRGYNTCDEANPRRTERGLEVVIR